MLHSFLKDLVIYGLKIWMPAGFHPSLKNQNLICTKAGLLTLMLFMMLPIVQSKASFPHHYSPQRAQTR